MIKILILYYSRTQSTKQLARFIARGVESAGGESWLRRVPAIRYQLDEDNQYDVEETIAQDGDPYVQLNELKLCDGLALGSPTRFGNMAAPVKHFIDQTSELWLNGALSGKPACVFTSTSSLHGGQESTLLSMMLPLLHQGMVLVGLPYSEPELHDTLTGGTPYGVSHFAGANNQNELSDEEKKLAKAQGYRLAKLAESLKK